MSVAKGIRKSISRIVQHNWKLYIFLLPGLIWLITFCYVPMYGVLIAFKDFDSRLGITGSPFVGLKYFRQFFSTNIASTTIMNTLMLGIETTAFVFPVPIPNNFFLAAASSSIRFSVVSLGLMFSGSVTFFRNSFMNQFDEGHYLFAPGTDAWLETFAYEFRNDILPFVEAKYATYADFFPTEEKLIESRAHRAYAGFSMGSFTGFHAIWMHCLPYVGYIGNFSGCDIQNTGIAAQVAEKLNGDCAGYPVLYWYNGSGTKDSLHNEHLAAYRMILSACPDSLREGSDLSAGQNAFFVDKPGKAHNFENWIVDLYNITSVFFRAP